MQQGIEPKQIIIDILILECTSNLIRLEILRISVLFSDFIHLLYVNYLLLCLLGAYLGSPLLDPCLVASTFEELWRLFLKFIFFYKAC